jgi:hypothetical protein
MHAEESRHQGVGSASDSPSTSSSDSDSASSDDDEGQETYRVGGYLRRGIPVAGYLRRRRGRFVGNEPPSPQEAASEGEAAARNSHNGAGGAIRAHLLERRAAQHAEQHAAAWRACSDRRGAADALADLGGAGPSVVATAAFDTLATAALADEEKKEPWNTQPQRVTIRVPMPAEAEEDTLEQRKAHEYKIVSAVNMHKGQHMSAAEFVEKATQPAPRLHSEFMRALPGMNVCPRVAEYVRSERRKSKKSKGLFYTSSGKFRRPVLEGEERDMWHSGTEMDDVTTQVAELWDYGIGGPPVEMTMGLQQWVAENKDVFLNLPKYFVLNGARMSAEENAGAGERHLEVRWREDAHATLQAAPEEKRKQRAPHPARKVKWDENGVVSTQAAKAWDLAKGDTILSVKWDGCKATRAQLKADLQILADAEGPVTFRFAKTSLLDTAEDRARFVEQRDVREALKMRVDDAAGGLFNLHRKPALRKAALEQRQRGSSGAKKSSKNSERSSRKGSKAKKSKKRARTPASSDDDDEEDYEPKETRAPPRKQQKKVSFRPVLAAAPAASSNNGSVTPEVLEHGVRFTESVLSKHALVPLVPQPTPFRASDGGLDYAEWEVEWNAKKDKWSPADCEFAANFAKDNQLHVYYRFDRDPQDALGNLFPSTQVTDVLWS